MKIRENINKVLMQLDSDCVFTKLAQPFAGLTSVPYFSLSRELTQPDLEIYTSQVSDISTLFPDLRRWNGGQYSENGMTGGCADEDSNVAIMKSIAEAIERYAMTIVRKEECLVASADELGSNALDWKLFPQCLDEEYAKYSGIERFNPKSKIRWVKGVSLISGEELYVPLSLTHITTTPRRAEAFTIPISTGTAVHTDLYEALSRAILEVVERDSIALTWLLKLELSKIEVDGKIPAEFVTRFNTFEHSHIKQYLFDATTDLGIPVVYGIMAVEGHPKVYNVVTAASDVNPYAACAKAMREAVSTRQAVLSFPDCPDKAEDCFSLEHGAAYMGRPERNGAFDFLTKSKNTISISNIGIHEKMSSREELRWIIDRLKSMDLEAIAVELTTGDIRSHNVRAVRVIIPELMPMSYSYGARFLKHPRIYEYANKIGRKNFTVSDINDLPQPFA